MKWYRKFNPTLLHWVTGLFQMSLKIRNLSLCKKHILALQFCSISRLMKWYWKFNPTLLHWATAFLFKNSLADFWKMFPEFFRVLFVYIVKHIRLNIGPAVRPFVSPADRQSVSPSVHQSLSRWNLQSFSEVPRFWACLSSNTKKRLSRKKEREWLPPPPPPLRYWYYIFSHKKIFTNSIKYNCLIKEKWNGKQLWNWLYILALYGIVIVWWSI